MKVNEKLFYERHVPELIRQMSRVADALEKQNEINEKFLIIEKKKWIKENKDISESNSSKK
jgi:hypothetical protein